MKVLAFKSMKPLSIKGQLTVDENEMKGEHWWF